MEGNKGRKSKYKPEYAGQAKDLCLLGATDKGLAEVFEVDEETIRRWRVSYPDFSDAIKEGKTLADSRVAAALYKRALGFNYDETTYEKLEPKVDGESQDERDIKLEIFKKKVVTKMLPGDVGAQMNWLKNRQRQNWNDGAIDFSKLTEDQLDTIIEKLKKNLNHEK